MQPNREFPNVYQGKFFKKQGIGTWRIESTSSAIEGNPRLRRPKDLRRNTPLPAARAFATKPVSSLFRGDLRCRDELRHPLLSAFKVLAVHRLELGRRERVRRWALEQCCAQ